MGGEGRDVLEQLLRPFRDSPSLEGGDPAAAFFLALLTLCLTL